MVYPVPATDTRHLEREVKVWCDRAAEAGYFAPLHGALARRIVRLMGWPRWVPKLVAMHRLLTSWLEHTRPRILIAPAEKDWSAYCGHHAARRLGIPTVGCRHGAWPLGTRAERYDHRYVFPATPTHVLAFTPGDETLCQKVTGVRAGNVVWRGNPRLDKPGTTVPDAVAGDALRILIATRGTGPGSPNALRRLTRPLNTRLITTLFERLGDRVRVRTHPWDSPQHFPGSLRHLFLSPGEDLDRQLANYAAVVTSYSTAAVDAAASGRPVFLWDYGDLQYDQSEIAAEGAMVAMVDLETLCEAVVRFVHDPAYRRSLLDRAARFPAYLHERLRSSDGSMTGALADWLEELINTDPLPGEAMSRALTAATSGARCG
jgi:hypothetical protein